jgi:CheY-like chemotaxis protein
MGAHTEVLVVDDEREYMTLINKKLVKSGYHTVLANNGEEALIALWERQGIGLVILDVRMPIINGLNIFEIIRKDFPDKRIIVSSVLQKDEQRFLIYDADDYYYKSEDLSILIDKIDTILNYRNRGGAIRKNEKRNYRRMPVNVLAGFERYDHHASAPCAHFLSYTKDLSLLGGRFIVGEEVEVGQFFSIALELPVNFLPLLIDCEVVWVKKMEEFDLDIKGSVEIGVRFVKLDSPRDEEKLKNYLNCG